MSPTEPGTPAASFGEAKRAGVGEGRAPSRPAFRGRPDGGRFRSAETRRVRPTVVGAPPAVETDPARRAIQHQRAQLLTWGRDPFLAGKGQATGELALSGILWDASRPLAIINGMTLTVGDEVEGFQVLDIQADHVTLTDGTATYDLRIVP